VSRVVCGGHEVRCSRESSLPRTVDLGSRAYRLEVDGNVEQWGIVGVKSLGRNGLLYPRMI